MSDALIHRIHDAPTRAVLAITGGGSRAIAELLEVPGGSRTLLSAVVPYSVAALIEWLGGAPEQFCSAATARRMAMQALSNARRMTDSQAPLAGVSCTASLASDRPKRGPHRIHAAWQTADATCSVSLELIKNRRSRAEEEELATRLVLNLLAEACDVEDRLPLELLDGEVIERRHIQAPPQWVELLTESKTPRAVPIGDFATSPAPRVVFPGAFHPLHAGHEQMASIASERLGAPVDFELSVTNVDKPSLDYVEMQDRSEQFVGRRLWLTNTPVFVDKARLFSGASFVVGLDTIIRIADSRYYSNDPVARDMAIDSLAAAGCRFLVFGRRHGGGFETLSRVALPPALARLCDEVSESEFRADVSSTELRKA